MGLILKNSGQWWPNGVVAYRIKMSDFNGAQRSVIMDGIGYWESRSLIRFVPQTTEPDFVTFQKHNQKCDSDVGRRGGEQAVRCDLSDPSFDKGSIAHEIGHTLGFFHEHQRPDRDAVVAVARSAIQDEPQDYKIVDDLPIGPQLPVGP